ncbi:MAG: hypothetical protein M3N93_11275 [Acidobacteriota bacterium]|nr:hypothetical protein [Acidobacteriota bacterium]
MSSYPDDILKLEPLLDRLEHVEARLKAVEARPAGAELEMRVRLHARDIETLQMQMNESRQRAADEFTLVKKRFREISQEVPALLESMLIPHLTSIREGMHAEIEKFLAQKLTALEDAMENRISHRMASLEQALIDQAGIITTLSERAIESDSNLQRLISAVEKLCARTEARSEGRELPFETELAEAAGRQPEPPQRIDAGFRPQIVKQGDDGRRRPRTPLTRL